MNMIRPITAHSPATYSVPGLLRLNLSSFRKVFVCGDIHGCFPLLDQRLAEIGYSSTDDALISVGDLVDRGAHSDLALGFLRRPNVWAVSGNHEHLLLNAWLHPEDDAPCVNFIANGGGWFFDLPRSRQIALAQAFCSLPLAIEALTPGGRTIGIVHAAVPGNDWSNVRALPVDVKINTTKRGDARSEHQAMVEFMTWDRQGVRDAIRFGNLGFELEEYPVVENIDHVFHGHNILRQPMRAGNTTWLDTGAFTSGIITVFDADAASAG